MSMSWEMEYKKRLRMADDALQCVQSGMRVYIQPGCAEPETLVEALMRRGPEVFNVEIVHMMTMGCAPYVAPEMAAQFLAWQDGAESKLNLGWKRVGATR
jgi:4-hydroxybutyrate CoA-transferase